LEKAVTDANDPVMETEKATLKPCPFCGGEAEVHGTGYHGPADCYDVEVRCSVCDASGPEFIVDQDDDNEQSAVSDATSAWNRRTT